MGHPPLPESAGPPLPGEPTGRFTGRAEIYRRFRWPYPQEIISLLQERCGLTRSSVVADIGAGTGMLSELFLRMGNAVFAIEPNAEMRAACSELSSSYPGLTCVDGTAEATGLPDRSVDFVTAGRALHWFDQEKCRPEFLRILGLGGWVVLVSHGRRKGDEAILQEYEALLKRHSQDYAANWSRYSLGDSSRKFFANCEVQRAKFTGEQAVTYEELEGETISLSIMPLPGDPRFAAMQKDLRDYFERHQSDGKIRLPTVCNVYFGQLR